jgi:hypothetical protein
LQKDVILSALGLFDRKDGPVLIADYPRDDPRERLDPGWRAPTVASTVSASDGIADALQNATAELSDPYRRSVAQRGRASMG